MHEESPEHREGEVIGELQQGLHAARSAAAAGDGEGGEGVSKRDYYEILEVTQDRERDRDQERLSPAGDEVPPGSQSGRPAGRREIQGSAPRPTRFSPTREKRSLYDRFGHAGVKSAAGGGAGFDPSVFQEFGDFADILGNMFGFGDMFGGGRRRGGPQRGADLRYDLEISFEESAKGAETTIQIPRQETCETCSGIGRGAGLERRRTCPQCQGHGQVRFQQGFFTVARTCPQCRGAGKIITKPCADLPRRRPRRARAQDHRQDSRRASPPASSCGCSGEGEAGSAGGPAGHLYVVVHVQEHEFFRRDGEEPVLRDPGELHDRRARRRDPGADARRPRDGEGAGRDADRHDAAAEGQGDARRQRPRPRRSVRDRAGADAEAS